MSEFINNLFTISLPQKNCLSPQKFVSDPGSGSETIHFYHFYGMGKHIFCWLENQYQAEFGKIIFVTTMLCLIIFACLFVFIPDVPVSELGRSQGGEFGESRPLHLIDRNSGTKRSVAGTYY